MQLHCRHVRNFDNTWNPELESFWGADIGEEVGAYDGFKDRDDEECEDFEDDQAEEAGSAAGPEPGWG